LSQAVAIDHLTADAIAAAGLPSWLEQRKLADQRTFAELPMPDSTSMEDWRRTDVSHIDPHAYEPAASDAQPAAGDVDGGVELKSSWERSGEGGALITQQGGTSTVANLPGVFAEQGVIVSSLETAAREHPELVQTVPRPRGGPRGGRQVCRPQRSLLAWRCLRPRPERCDGQDAGLGSAVGRRVRQPPVRPAEEPGGCRRGCLADLHRRICLGCRHRGRPQQRCDRGHPGRWGHHPVSRPGAVGQSGRSLRLPSGPSRQGLPRRAGCGRDWLPPGQGLHGRGHDGRGLNSTDLRAHHR